MRFCGAAQKGVRGVLKKGFRVLILVLIAAASAAFCAFILRYDLKMLGFSVVSEAQARSIVAENGSMEPLHCNILFQGEALPYDSVTNTYYLYQHDKNKWEGRLYFGSYAYEGFWVTDNVDTLAPTGRHTLLICADNSVLLCNVEICNTPLLALTVENEAGQSLSPDEFGDGNHFCGFKMFSFDEACGKIRVQGGKAHIRIRGATSRDSIKNSYKLTLADDSLHKSNKTFLGLRNDDDWILNSMNSDIDKTHEMVAYQLWSQMDEADASFSTGGVKCAYLELCINDDYRGLYLLQTRLDAKQTALDKETDFLYKSNDSVLPDDGLLEQTGYAREVGGVEIKHMPPIETRTAWTALNRYRDTLLTGECEEHRIGWDEAADAACLPNIVDFHLFKQALYAEDNAVKNAYYLAKGAENGRIYKIPWDVNYIFGDIYKADAVERTVYDADWADKWMCENEIDTLLEIDAARAAELLKQRWALHSDKALNPDNVRRLMLAAFSEIWDSGAFRRNSMRWSAIEPSFTYDEWMERFEVIWEAYGRKWQQINDYAEKQDRYF